MQLWFVGFLSHNSTYASESEQASYRAVGQAPLTSCLTLTSAQPQGTPESGPPTKAHLGLLTRIEESKEKAEGRIVIGAEPYD